MKAHHTRVSSKHGMLPGSAVYVGSRTPNPTKMTAYVYSRQKFETLTDVNIKQIQEALKNDCHIWIDICGLADTQSIVNLCRSLSIHPLIIEDVLNTHQRPKMEAIDKDIHITLKLLDVDKEQCNYQTEQISLINRSNLLISIRESELYDFKHLYQRFSEEYALVHAHESNFLMYLVIDTVVDDYFRFIEATGDQLEQMENNLIQDPDQLNLKTLYTVKRRTTTLRKILSPLRDVIHLLLSEHPQEIHETYNIYYRDLYDHCNRLLEQVDLHREISSSMLDIYLSIQNNRMNETMKVLTLFASIFIPLGFIASVYGMNFTYMPELRWHYSYPVVLLCMLTLAIGMLIYFKHKRIF